MGSSFALGVAVTTPGDTPEPYEGFSQYAAEIWWLDFRVS